MVMIIWISLFKFHSKAEVDGAALKVQAWFRRGGQVVAVLRSVHGVRALPVQQVKEGLNEFTLPLQPGETGEVNLCFMQEYIRRTAVLTCDAILVS